MIDASLVTTTAGLALPANSVGNRLAGFHLLSVANSGNAAHVGIQFGVTSSDVILERLYVQGFYVGAETNNAIGLVLFNVRFEGSQNCGLSITGGDSVTMVGGGAANTIGYYTKSAGIRISGGAQHIKLLNPLVDECGANSSVLVLTANDVLISGQTIYYGNGGQGIGFGWSGAEFPTRVTIENVRVTYFSGGSIPAQTINIAGGSGHVLDNVTTVPNGGGDINDLGTDTSFENVNGRWKHPATDASGTPGNATINKASGKVAIATGQAAVTVTNSLVTAASIVTATIQTADATLTFLKSVVPGAGAFTITGNANATAATTVAFTVQN